VANGQEPPLGLMPRHVEEGFSEPRIKIFANVPTGPKKILIPASAYATQDST